MTALVFLERACSTKTPSAEEISKHDPYQGGEKEIGGNPVDITDNLRERKGQVLPSKKYANNWDRIFGKDRREKPDGSEST
eukprot:CAMPEP_0170170732 /NCGR_PEP_ID=MMETSP0040_2-20121228/3757_1 /TAXON_ID=641309 /ORGANISM="Lotharella oceanica, Strain CCMP622" /LENGTH=80 /DNA_ID=CAMNT_0010410325 /DNA_START=51 /DNA_END=293 /DNA_ORIENTATION=+